MIYFDNCATTKPYNEVVEKMFSTLTEDFGNPSSLHNLGKRAHADLTQAREHVAEILVASNEEIVFTSGGTESDNLAITGACLANRQVGRHIITTTIEHPAVMKTIKNMKREGWAVDYIPFANGRLDLTVLEKLLSKETVLVSAMLVNNELGTILPIRSIKEIICEHAPQALLHCDAVQALGKVPFTVDELGTDLLSVSSHKIHGPKGAGALYARQGSNIFPILFGGGQEDKLRSGTEAMPALVGFGEAARVAYARRDGAIAHMQALRDYCFDALMDLPDIHMNSKKDGAPHIVNFSLPQHKNSEIVSILSDKGVCISAGAACKSNHSRGPSMLMSFGLSEAIADSALRVSFSESNTFSEIDFFIAALKEIS